MKLIEEKGNGGCNFLICNNNRFAPLKMMIGFYEWVSLIESSSSSSCIVRCFRWGQIWIMSLKQKNALSKGGWSVFLVLKQEKKISEI